MKKEVAYFIAVSKNQVFAAANVAIGINKHIQKKNYDIVIYYSDITEENLAALERIPFVKAVKFELEENFIRFMMDELPDECRFRSRERLMCFAHYEAFLLLDKYENVVWLDSDVLVQEDISLLCEYGPIAFSKDFSFLVSDQFTVIPDGVYDYNRSAIQIGLVVFSDRLPYETLYSWCYEKSRFYAKYARNPEQAVMNLMLQEFGIKPKILPLECHCDYRDDKAYLTKIVHFGGEQKVWNNENIVNAYPEWYRNHLKWIAYGGGTSNDYKLDLFLPSPRIGYDYSMFFPFECVPKDSKIIIYGWGKAGREYIRQIEVTSYCKVAAIADEKCESKLEGYNLISPNAIVNYCDAEYVVISIRNPRIAKEVKKRLVELGCKEATIVWKE